MNDYSMTKKAINGVGSLSGMIRKLLFICVLQLLPIFGYSQSLAIINDPDGYTNMRKGPGSSYEIVDQILKNEIFLIEDLIGDWYLMYKVEKGYQEGYIHKSRVLPMNKLQKVGLREFKDKYLTISDSKINFKIKRGNFNKSDHHYELENDKYVIKIDGKTPYGVDC